jgi:hypothetical protein
MHRRSNTPRTALNILCGASPAALFASSVVICSPPGPDLHTSLSHVAYEIPSKRGMSKRHVTRSKIWRWWVAKAGRVWF